MELIGKKYGDLRVIAEAGKRGTNRYLLCRCKCHAKTIIAYSALARGQKRCSICRKKAMQQRSVCPQCGGKKSAQARCCRPCLIALFPPPARYPKPLNVVAKKYGVSRQRVSQVIIAVGWDKAMEYFQTSVGVRRIKDFQAPERRKMLRLRRRSLRRRKAREKDSA